MKIVAYTTLTWLRIPDLFFTCNVYVPEDALEDRFFNTRGQSYRNHAGITYSSLSFRSMHRERGISQKRRKTFRDKGSLSTKVVMPCKQISIATSIKAKNEYYP